MTAEQKIEFDLERASKYDLDIRKAIPGYESLHDMAQHLLKAALSPSADILIVGSGTGMELISYSQRNPQWSLTGVDPSDDMMAIAKRELASKKLLERVNLHTGYVDSLAETKLMDAATLMLVMHFVPDDGAKLKLLKNIARRLKPGAEMILADLHGDKSAPCFAKFQAAWQALYFNRLDDLARTKAKQNFKTAINQSIYFVPETRIIELLNIAGFKRVNKLYNAFLFGGWTAQYTGN
ncbi:MAG: class I SAM-dependent methyltransferase [Pleurocapsa sp.]